MPYKNFITEVLSAHADQLLNKNDRNPDYVRLFPNHRDLPSLLSLATHVKSALEPVAPAATFTDRLHADLLAAAQSRQQRHQQSPATLMASPFVISSIVGGLFALLGIFFFVRHQIQQKAGS